MCLVSGMARSWHNWHRNETKGVHHGIFVVWILGVDHHCLAILIGDERVRLLLLRHWRLSLIHILQLIASRSPLKVPRMGLLMRLAPWLVNSVTTCWEVDLIVIWRELSSRRIDYHLLVRDAVYEVKGRTLLEWVVYVRILPLVTRWKVTRRLSVSVD